MKRWMIEHVELMLLACATVIALLTVGHMFLKVRGQRLKNKHQRLENEILEKQLRG